MASSLRFAQPTLRALARPSVVAKQAVKVNARQSVRRGYASAVSNTGWSKDVQHAIMYGACTSLGMPCNTYCYLDIAIP